MDQGESPPVPAASEETDTPVDFEDDNVLYFQAHRHSTGDNCHQFIPISVTVWHD